MKLYLLGLCAALVVAAPLSFAAGEKGKMASPEVLKTMSELVETGAQVASPALHQGDDFEPYGVLMKKDGSLQVVRYQKADAADAKSPPAMEIFKRITLTILDATRKNPDIVAASTFAATVSTANDGKTVVPMIRAEVDHRDGAPLIVLMPFQRKDGKLEFGTTPSLPGTNFLFFREEEGGAAAAQSK